MTPSLYEDGGNCLLLRDDGGHASLLLSPLTLTCVTKITGVGNFLDPFWGWRPSRAVAFQETPSPETNLKVCSRLFSVEVGERMERPGQPPRGMKPFGRGGVSGMLKSTPFRFCSEVDFDGLLWAFTGLFPSWRLCLGSLRLGRGH